MSPESIRTFIALELDTPIKEKIAVFQNALKQTQSLKASWVAGNNFHLTMKFLGDTPKKNIEKIAEILKTCCNNTRPIDCTLTKVGTFPHDRAPRVIWVGIEKGKNQLADIAQTMESALCDLGFKKEKREFKSHITIARIKRVLDRNLFQTTLEQINGSFSPIEFTANKITLFQSTLSAQGPLYNQLSQYFLQ